uniref:Uncharacterized protein n=1 Tax=viral metagenome TaxID=1070528 RepID=A0A6C0K9T5_9ZZZZ
MSSFSLPDQEVLLEKSTGAVNVAEQQYATISLIGPNCPQKHEQLQVMLRGNFPSAEKAQEHALESKGKFGVYTIEQYCWVILPPTEDVMASQEQHDSELYELLSGYLTDQEDNNARHAERVIANRKAAAQRVAEAKENNGGTEETKGGAEAEAEAEAEVELAPPVAADVPLPYQAIETPWDVSEPHKGAVPDQKFAVISIASVVRSKVALKIFAAFATEDEAKTYSCLVRDDDPSWNVHVVAMYKWLPLPPDLSLIDESHYLDESLDSFIQANSAARDHTQKVKKSNALLQV